MADDFEDTQIASRISDIRVSREYSYIGEGGQPLKVHIVEFPTVDDLMTQGMQNVVAEMIEVTDYVSIMEYSVVTELLRTHLPVERK